MEGKIQCVLCTMSSLLESHKLRCTLIRIVGSHSSKSIVSNLVTLIGYKNFRENVNTVHKFHYPNTRYLFKITLSQSIIRRCSLTLCTSCNLIDVFMAYDKASFKASYAISSACIEQLHCMSWIVHMTKCIRKKNAPINKTFTLSSGYFVEILLINDTWLKLNDNFEIAFICKS